MAPLGRGSVRGITHVGGTILGTTNRGNPLRYPTLGKNGQLYEKDRTDALVIKLKAHKWVFRLMINTHIR